MTMAVAVLSLRKVVRDESAALSFLFCIRLQQKVNISSLLGASRKIPVSLAMPVEYTCSQLGHYTVKDEGFPPRLSVLLPR